MSWEFFINWNSIEEKFDISVSNKGRGISSKNLSYNVKMILGGFPLKDYIEERAIGIANYIIDNNATVRQTAKAFGVSKSTVHVDVTK